jgi:hypothetical protein
MNLPSRATLLVLPFSLISCVSLSPTDRAQLRDIKALNLPEKTRKNQIAAGALNLLPGIGNFYLATGTDQGGQASVGFVNLLTWPLSVVWGIPQAAIDAKTINTQYTVYYYTIDPVGKKTLNQALYQSNHSEPAAEVKSRKLP